MKDKTTILIDVKKAYDTVDTRPLELISLQGEETQKLWEVTREVYRIHLRPRIGGRLIPKRVGLPQGSSLSPVLFVFLLHYYITEGGRDMKILEKLTAFADDVLIVDTKEKIEETYATVKDRLRKGGLIINRKKSEMVAKLSSKTEEIDGISRKESFK